MGFPGWDTTQREHIVSTQREKNESGNWLPWKKDYTARKNSLLKVGFPGKKTTQLEIHRFLEMGFPDRKTTQREKEDRFLKMSSPAGTLQNEQIWKTNQRRTNTHKYTTTHVSTICLLVTLILFFADGGW